MEARPNNDPSYGYTAHLRGVSFDDARASITEALKSEGFGILTEIDVASTLKSKLDLNFRRYVILGACNPHLAHQALEAEHGIGLLLPCNGQLHGRLNSGFGGRPTRSARRSDAMTSSRGR